MPNAPAREFRVHACHIDSHYARHVMETSFEAAAVAYVEHHPYAADEDHEIRVLVREVSSGHEHCFKIDLETGETKSCG
jgi:hypothetical protein